MRLAMRRQLRFVLLVLLLVSLCGCEPDTGTGRVAQSTPSVEVIVQGSTDGKEELQPIELDNCTGKADLSRTEGRSQSIEASISTELAARFGASAEVISGEVQAAVAGTSAWGAQRSTSIQLTAPPNTKMRFVLAWTGTERMGVVMHLRGSDVPIVFREFTPTDVRIKSQEDIGCGGSGQPVPVFVPETKPAGAVAPTVAPAATARTVAEIPRSDVLLGTWEYKKARAPMPGPAGRNQIILAHGDIDNSGTCHMRIFRTGEPVQGLGEGTYQLWLITGPQDYVDAEIAGHQRGAAADAGGSCPMLP